MKDAAVARPSLWGRLDMKLARLQHVTATTYYGAEPLPYEEWKAKYDALPEPHRG
jgi:hypothetical protein